MKTPRLVQTLGLAVMVCISMGTLAHGNDEYRPGADNYAFRNHPAFQENLRLMREVDARQDKQMDRILSGFYERRITPQEFRRLMDEQRDIQKLERRFLADGLLNRYEYQKLDFALNAASRNIFQEGHDVQGRPGRSEWHGAEQH